MQLILPTDSMFLLGESREHPFHVGSLQLFKPPEGVGIEFIRDAFETMLKQDDVQPTFRKHPAFFGGLTNLAWTFDDEVELDYHVRRSALPNPGRIRELLELTSRLHTSLLDRHRPLWETHLVEGLGGRAFRRLHQGASLAAGRSIGAQAHAARPHHRSDRPRDEGAVDPPRAPRQQARDE